MGMNEYQRIVTGRKEPDPRTKVVPPEEIGPYELAALLEMFRSDLHPTYANTSRRGRGIGGQALTSQCNYLDPNRDEYRIIKRVDDAVHEWFLRAEREGVDMQEVRRKILRSEC